MSSGIVRSPRMGKAPREGLVLGPDSAGSTLTVREFDRADFVEGWRYELIHGVLVVSPTPHEEERDPNDALGAWLRWYQERDPRGSNLIWAGLGRSPRRGEPPQIIAEFVSAGKRDRKRDYEEKRAEYMEIGVIEYLIIDRFERTLTVFFKQGKKIKKRIVREGEIYTTPLLPGFELPLAKLLALADDWQAPNTAAPGGEHP